MNIFAETYESIDSKDSKKRNFPLWLGTAQIRENSGGCTGSTYLVAFTTQLSNATGRLRFFLVLFSGLFNNLLSEIKKTIMVLNHSSNTIEICLLSNKHWSKKRGDRSKRHNIFFSRKHVSGESGLCLLYHKFTSIDERNLSIIEWREFYK